MQYIAVTGWNRQVTMFYDNPDQFKAYPFASLPSEKQIPVWHKDDILSMSFCLPNLVATSSYDGLVVVTNIHSGHILHVLNPLEYEGSNPAFKSVDKGNLLKD